MLKENVLSRCKAQSRNELVQFALKELNEFYKHKLIACANGRNSSNAGDKNQVLFLQKTDVCIVHVMLCIFTY